MQPLRSSVTSLAIASAVVAFSVVVGAMPAAAATFTVSKTADTADGTCDADCSLREAVIAANALPGTDIIVLPAGTYVLTLAGATEDASATGDLDILDALTINGAGAGSTIVDGNATDRIFHIFGSATSVTITGVTIRNGNGVGFGGGVNKEGSGTVQLQNAVVTGNTALSFGGGINNNDNLGSMNLDFTTVSNNVAGSFGGGINNNSGGSLTVRDSLVTGNSAGGFGGGGINNNSSGATLVVRTTISNNTAQNGGGLNNNSSGSLSVADTLVSGNTAAGGSQGGGGILNNSSGFLNVFASTLSANSSGGSGGGGVNSNSSGAVDIQISTITGNTTTGSEGGGGIFKNSSATITVSSATITGNASTNGGRNIHLDSPSGSFSLTNTIIANVPSGANCAGNPVTSNGFNLASDASCNLVAAGDRPNQDPLLAPLANNGGPTPTHGLQAGSPAIDTGTLTSPSLPIDQRGVVRPVGAGFDIGAFEGTVGGAVPTLSINSVSGVEGNSGTTTLSFTVTLSAASAQTVTVNFATADGTATAGSDYSAASGVVTFAPGSTSQLIAVTINGDTGVEAGETFVVNLSGAANATIASGQGTGTILNDDGAAPPIAETAIPTLSEWAMLILSSLLAGFAVLAIRRREGR